MKKTIYYDLVLDETGNFLRKEAARKGTKADITLHSVDKDPTPAEEKKFDSANVGFLLKSEEGFLLTDENGRLKIDNRALRTAFTVWYSIVSKRCKNGLSLKDFMHISEFGVGGCKLNSDKRTEVQAELLKKYKKGLNRFDSNWKLVAFEQNKDKLSNAIEQGEAAASAYAETLFEGLADLVVQKYIDNYPNEVSFHIGIASRSYLRFILLEDGFKSEGKSRVIPIGEFRWRFMNHVHEKYGEAAKKLCDRVCWFYSINAIEKPIWNDSAKLKELCIAYKSDAADENDCCKIIMQFLLTIADCLANGYRHKDEKQTAFFEGMAARTYKVGHLTDKQQEKEWKIRKAILEADCERMIKRMILFPTVGVVQDVSWEELYGKVQEKFKPFIDKFLVHEMLNMGIIKAKGLVNEISGIVQRDLRSRTNEREDKKRWIARLNSLLSLHKALVKRKEDNRAANLLGADAYLFLAHLYQNFGMDNEANTMLDNAKKLVKYWGEGRKSVYTLLRLNKLNDKFQANEVKEIYKDYLKKLRDDNYTELESEDTYTGDDQDNIAKINSIYIESLLIETCAVNASNAEEAIKEKTKKAIERNSKRALVKVQECFPAWSDRQYAYSHYFRLNVALGKMRVASRVLLASLRENIDREISEKIAAETKKGNFSTADFLGTQDAISVDDFFEKIKEENETQKEVLRSFVYLNFLTFYREQLQGSLQGKKGVETESQYLKDVFDRIESAHKDKKGNSKISNAVRENECGIYPVCLIYWRLAQIYRYRASVKANLSEAELSSKYYVKATEILEDVSNLRLLAIKIAILADYAEWLYLKRADAKYDTYIYKLKNAYVEFQKGCGTKSNDVKNIFNNLFHHKNLLNDLAKLAKAVPDYY